MKESPEIRELLSAALREDQAHWDVTARLVRDRKALARVVAQESGVFSGRAVLASAAEIFKEDLSISDQAEGKRFESGETLVEISGSVQNILSLERTLLNFLGHASGVATVTSGFVEAVGEYPTKILATRKTLPGLRELELTAVMAGGGHVHRRCLSDGILIKENHLQFESIEEILKNAEAQRSPLHKVEIEVQSLEQLTEALKNPPDVIMLDNFSVGQIQEAVGIINGRAEIEVSGGVTIDKVLDIARLGVHYISVGRLTHSASWLNLSMDYLP